MHPQAEILLNQADAGPDLIFKCLGGQKRKDRVRVRVPADCEKIVIGQSGDLLPAHFLIDRLIAVAHCRHAALVKHCLGMPAHVRSALTNTTLSIPVLNGRPALGTWQAIYLYEHRDQPHRRQVVAHLLGK